MSILTPSERRGAWLVATILIIGTAWDLYDAAFRGPRPFEHDAWQLQAPAAPADTSSGTSALVDLNRATVAELRQLPGIGPVLAARVVSYREAHGGFRRPEELLAVRGVGPTLFARVRARLRVSTLP